MKAILPLWSAPPSTSDEVRMSAFLGIRRLALLGIGEEPSGSDAKEKEGKGKGGKDKKGEVDDWILKVCIQMLYSLLRGHVMTPFLKTEHVSHSLEILKKHQRAHPSYYQPHEEFWK